MQPTPAIFKAYDIRGIVPSTLNEDVALGLGRAFGTAARAEGQTTVAVGRDGRLSGPAMSAALIQGLVEAGIEVIDVGLVTTPLLYFAASTLCSSGIQVTGSHNPKDYNGFKMVLNGRAIYGDEIQALRRTMEQESWQLVPGGAVRHVDVLPAYRERIVGDVKLARPLKIGVDCGNGIAGASAPAIFKAYDIRGIVPSTLNEDVALGLGRAFGTAARAEGQTTVAVGRDGRLSGPAMSAALIQGLVEAGIEVIDVGLVTTPLLYFAASTLCSSGIQVTGSHNPKDYNGFKMVLNGRAIFGDEIQALRRTMEQESWQLVPGGAVRHVDVLPAYRERIVCDVKLARPLKIVVDCGNGIAGASAPAIFRALGCEVTELFSEVDGNFPNHHPDPSKPENLRDLIEALKTSDAELGLAFDGDGDRLGIVTKDGTNIFPDRQMMLFAQDVLSRVPGGEIIFDVKCTQRLAPAIAAARACSSAVRRCGSPSAQATFSSGVEKLVGSAFSTPLGSLLRLRISSKRQPA